ncbi:hypothetical protein EI555_021111, partial [Monodon monoceros]
TRKTKEFYHFLVEQVYTANRTMDSTLSLSTEEPVMRNTVKKYKIICIVLLTLLVAVSLALGLVAGLRQHEEQGSCRKKCFDASHRGLEGCRCDVQCKGRGDCCWDFEDTCLEYGRAINFVVGRPDWNPAFALVQMTVYRRKTAVLTIRVFAKEKPHGLKKSVAQPSSPSAQKETCGIHSKYLRSVYPTKTFPNHYTIVTGLYPESHGIIDNKMYDVHLNKNFSLSSKEKNNPVWWHGQPIWLTAMYQGLKAGTYFWPGSDVAINGTFPSIYRIYNRSVTYEERVFTLLKWLDLPKAERPDFYTIYVEQPDSAGHAQGPVSAAVIQALQLVDYTFGLLMEGLKQRNLVNCVNIILLADHGMDQTYCDKVEYMTNYFSQINFYMYEGPAPRIRTLNIPHDFFTFNSEEIVRNLSCRKPDQRFTPYLTPDLPKRLHYAKNVRIDKAHLLMDRQWQAVRAKAFSSCGGGNHGYNNEFKSMEAIFLAHGPSFKQQTEVEPFDNIEIYNLMCDLLHIQPAPNNGTHGSLNYLLKVPFYEPSHAEEVSKFSVCGFTVPLPTDTLGCSCPELQSNADIERVNQMLNLTQDEITTTEKLNLPFGRPRVIQKNKELCLLYHREYVSGFDKTSRMPLWSSYTVPKPGDISPLPPTVPDCLRADVRIAPSESQNCSFSLADKNITHGFLYPPAMWNYFHSVLLGKHAMERNGVNVVSGPIFDYNYDGHFDAPDEITEYVVNTSVPIPTHYFVVLTSCKNKSQTPNACTGWLDVLPFVIPHRPTNVESCPENKPEALWIEERFNAHVARVRDVELLTGLDFYQEKLQPVSEILQLKTYLPTFETII